MARRPHAGSGKGRSMIPWSRPLPVGAGTPVNVRCCSTAEIERKGLHMTEDEQFSEQLVVDSKPLSVEQLPRLQVYRISEGRLVVHRTWPESFGQEPSCTVYSDLESLIDDPMAL